MKTKPKLQKKYKLVKPVIFSWPLILAILIILFGVVSIYYRRITLRHEKVLGVTTSSVHACSKPNFYFTVASSVGNRSAQAGEKFEAYVYGWTTNPACQRAIAKIGSPLLPAGWSVLDADTELLDTVPYISPDSTKRNIPDMRLGIYTIQVSPIQTIGNDFELKFPITIQPSSALGPGLIFFDFDPILSFSSSGITSK
jgi:hypothetical protein